MILKLLNLSRLTATRCYSMAMSLVLGEMNIKSKSTKMVKPVVSAGDTKDTRKTASTSRRSGPPLKKGDLVCAYIMNSSQVEKLLQHGIVLEVNGLDDVYVLDNSGYARWYPDSRWRRCDKED